MSVVKITPIDIPVPLPDGVPVQTALTGSTDSDGLEEVLLLRPADGRTTWLYCTRWRDEEAYQASQSSGQSADVWSFAIEQDVKRA